MANIRVLPRLDRILRDLNKVEAHVRLHSGIDFYKAIDVDNTASAICQQAARLVGIAREKRGGQPVQEELLKNVRKALG